MTTRTYKVGIYDQLVHDQREGLLCRTLLLVQITASDPVTAAKAAFDRLTHWPLLYGNKLEICGKLRIDVE